VLPNPALRTVRRWKFLSGPFCEKVIEFRTDTTTEQTQKATIPHWDQIVFVASFYLEPASKTHDDDSFYQCENENTMS